MRAKNHVRLTSRERLSRGLASTAVGPVDVTRGLGGLGGHGAQAGASRLPRPYREGRLAHDLQSAQEALVQELAAAQEVVTGLPEALQQARRAQRRRPRPWGLAGAGGWVPAPGACGFWIVRPSPRRAPPALPRSVGVAPPL